MKVLVGEGTGGRFASILKERGWGRMWVARDRHIYVYDGEPWGLDNGAYRDWVRGHAFDEEAWMRVLERASGVADPPYLAILPDLVGGGKESLSLSESWLHRVPDFPWYLAVQDGIQPDDVAHLVGEVAGIFLGGTNPFKAAAGKWCHWAHAHGLRFHYGRAGTLRKVAHAKRVGADSIDSSFPLWTRNRMAEFIEEVVAGPIQNDLFHGGGDHG